MLGKIIKVILIATGVALVLLLFAMLIITLGWYGFFIVLGIIGLTVAGLYFRKIWLRRREQRFVNQIVEQDENLQKGQSDKEREQRRELQDRWKDAMGTLKRSHLRKLGNPLYVLPWYMVIGESGSGKTTAIKSAKLSSPFAEAPRVSGLSGTKNCDWWFFDHSIIIDTAGRYAIPVDEGRDKDEWQKFLNLLVKYRRKEPLNGLIVTLAADKLLTADATEIEADARSIRMRVQELMLALGVKFPIYLLITKCDLVQGMTDFCEQLPEEAHKQAMGFLNQGKMEEAGELTQLSINSIVDRLRNLRLLLLHEIKTSKIDPALLLFPDEFAKLQSGLETFIQVAFQETPYQEVPILRGLYFSSGCQEGTPYSHFLKTLGLIGEQDVLPGSSKGLFLHDFFARILPADRTVFAPTGRALEWNRLTRNYGFAAWVILVTALCGVLAFSFINNMTALQSVSNDYIKGPDFKDDLLLDVDSLDGFRQEIITIEEKNRDWWVPRLGLDHSLQAESKLKKRYSEKFTRYLLQPFTQGLRAEIADISDVTPAEDIGTYVIHILKRIALLKNRLENRSTVPEDLDAIPKKAFLLSNRSAFPPQVSETLPQLYRDYLRWTSDAETLEEEKEQLNEFLQSILWRKGGDLNWLVAWANSLEDLPGVTLADFWNGEGTQDSAAYFVGAAFTRKGKQRIDDFIEEMKIDLKTDKIADFNQKIAAFEPWYQATYLAVWDRFAASFSAGQDMLRGGDDWRLMAQKIADNQGPYFALLDRMAEELVPFVAQEKLPHWVQQVFRYKELSALAPKTSEEEKNLFSAAFDKGKTLIAKGRQVVDKAQGDSWNRVNSIKAYHAMRQSLKSIAKKTASSKAVYDASYKVYEEDSVTGESPFYTAYRSFVRLRDNMLFDPKGEENFWKLVNGPLDFLWSYFQTESSCYLQDIWDAEVLNKVKRVTAQRQKWEMLFQNPGHALSFIDGPAKPFYQQGQQKRQNYFYENSFPFEEALFSMMDRGQVSPPVAQSSYLIFIKGVPTDLNPEARLNLHATHLVIPCANENLMLDTESFPTRVTPFSWFPETCGEANLRIEFENNLILEKGFSLPDFIRVFENGQEVFTPQDFPGQRQLLERSGIRKIKVKYQLSGKNLRTVKALNQWSLGSIPQKIGKCWD